MHDPMSRARNGTHHFVNELRVPIDEDFEICALQAENTGIAKCAQADGVSRAVDETEFAREVAVLQDCETGRLAGSGV